MNDRSGNIRTSKVGLLYIISAASSAMVQIGDRGTTNASLRAIAIQRKEDHWTAGEAYFESYEIFTRRRPVLIDPEFDSGDYIRINRVNRCPDIRTGVIRVIAFGSSSTVQIGNGKAVIGDSRVKHIRQFPGNGAEDSRQPPELLPFRNSVAPNAHSPSTIRSES